LLLVINNGYELLKDRCVLFRSTDGKENVEMVRTRSKGGVGKKTKISAGGKTRRRKRKR
jgi:hypothetical protein